ncbi:glycine cleavage system protein H [Candidatus Pyrohabitans sp.]
MELKTEQVLKVGEYEFPLDRLYYRGRNAHIWVKREGDTLLLGIDAFLAESAGYLNYLSVTAEKLERGEAFANIESAKFVSKLYSPVAGRVVEVNREVMENPRLVNQSPYEAWIVRVKPSSEAELSHEELLSESEELREWIEQEIARLEEE